MKYSMYDHTRNVLEAETFLRRNHLLEGGTLINPDGSFDTDTTDTVRLFQQQNGLAVTGVIDFETWKALAENHAALCLENECIDFHWTHNHNLSKQT